MAWHRLPVRAVLVALALAVGPLASVSLRAEEPGKLDLDALTKGPSAAPWIWRPYFQTLLPPPDFGNGARLAQLLAGGTLKLSLKEFLKLVIDNNLDIAAARYNYAIAHVDLLRTQSGQAARGTSASALPAAVFAGAIGAGVSQTAGLSPGGTGGAAISTQGKLVTLGPRGNFDPTVSVNLSYDHVVNPLNTTKVAGAASVTIPSTVLQTRYQQELSFGTSYAISFNLQRQVSTQAGLLFNPALSSFFAAQVYQPLLNGFGSALTRRFVTLAENDRAIVREAIHSTINNTLASAANAYWDLIALRENVRAAEDAVATAQREVGDDRQRVDLDVMTPLDLIAAESQLASARVRLVTARTRLQQQDVLIKTLVSRTEDPALDAADLVPTDDLPGPLDIEIPPLDASLATAMTSRSTVRQAELSLKNQRIAEEYTRKNLLPVFSVYGAVNVFGLAPSADPAVRQLLQWEHPEFSLGFTWSMPVLNRSAQADDIRARLERREAEAALQRTRIQIQGQVQSATASLTQGRARVEAAQRAVVTSRRVLDSARAKVAAGIATPYDVTLAQGDLTAAQAAETQARVGYAKALVAHQLAVGGLLERNGIAFEQALQGDLFAAIGPPVSGGPK